MDNLSPNRMIMDALESLDNTMYKVLIHLYGIDRMPGLSYEELSSKLEMSVERLYETEKAALRKLRSPKTAKHIINAVKIADQEIWQALSTEDNVVYKSNLPQQISENLPGEYLIAIKCGYENVKAWLSFNAFPTISSLCPQP